MHHIQNPLFQTIFDQLTEPRIVVKPNAPDFTIAVVNRAYEAATYSHRHNVVDKSIWEVFTVNPTGGSSVKILRDGLLEAVSTKQEVKLPLFRYDITNAEDNILQSWWQIEILPILNAEDIVQYLICTTRNVTIQDGGNDALKLSQQREVALLIQQQSLQNQLDVANENQESSNRNLAASEKSLAEANTSLHDANEGIDNLTQRNQTLTGSEYRLNRMIMTTPIGLTILQGRDLVIEIANAQILEIWGRTLPEVHNKRLLDIFPELDGQPFPQMLQTVFDTGLPIAMPEIPVAILSPEGKRKDIYVDFSYNPLFDEAGKVEAILVTVNDITELTKLRNALQEYQEELKAINEELAANNEELAASNEEVNSSNEELVAINEELTESTKRIELLNQQLEAGNEELAASNEEVKSSNEELIAINEELAESTRRIDLLNQKLEASNEELAASNEEVKSSNEELVAINEELTASTLRIELLNEKLIKSESGFRKLIEEAPVAMLVFKGDDMEIDIVNQAMLKLLNKDAGIRGQALFAAIPELYGQPAADMLFGVYRTGEPVYGNEMPVMLNRNGKEETGYFNFTYTPLTEDGKIIGVVDMAVEVTEQVKARQLLEGIISEKTILEKTLRASEQRLQGILDTMAEGVVIVDVYGKPVYANTMAQRILGLTENEIKNGLYHNPEWQNLRVDGSALPDDEHPVTVMLNTGLSIYDQEIALQPTIGERFYISINAAPIIDDNRTLTGGIGTFMDVTNRRKMTMLKDDFISVASHELKTPVTTLKASLQLLDRIKDNVKPEMLAKLVAQSNKSLNKLSNLINDLLNTNRISQGQLQLHKTTFTVAQTINDCCQHIIAAGVHNIILKGDMNIKVFADEQQIDQVLVNFVNNAVKYAPNSKDIIIEVKQVDNTLKVAVTDNGPGIDPEKLPHLFDRYYRTDYSGASFSGLGLGLYICAEIIKKHNGEIGAESELDSGSTFWFTLPV